MARKSNYTGVQIRNFLVVEKTTRKRTRPDGRNHYIYICKCNCGTIFESTVAEFEYRYGCDQCAKQHHYQEVWKSKRANPNLKPARRTPLSKLSPDSKKGEHGSYANYVVNGIKATAIKRQLAWDLDPIKVFYLIQEPCYYCGFEVHFPETRNGLDRLDNTNGYIEGNVVPCCFPCNIAKRDQTIESFRAQIIRIYKTWASKPLD